MTNPSRSRDERGSAVVAVLVLVAITLLVVAGVRIFGARVEAKLRCQGEAVAAIGSGARRPDPCGDGVPSSTVAASRPAPGGSGAPVPVPDLPGPACTGLACAGERLLALGGRLLDLVISPASAASSGPERPYSAAVIPSVDGIFDVQAERFDDYERFLDDLELLARTRTGGELLDWLRRDIGTVGARLRITVTQDGRGFFGGGAFVSINSVITEAKAMPAGRDSGGRYPILDGRAVYTDLGTPVPVEAIQVGYDAAFETLGADGEPCAPAFVRLFHELRHVKNAREGRWLRVRDPGDPSTHGSFEESQTIGIGGYRDDPLTENALRRELGLSERESHGFHC
jgi:hypothetical protein